MSYKSSLLPGYIAGDPNIINAIKMIIITLVVIVFLSISLIVNYYAKRKNKEEDKINYVIYIISGIALLSGYIIFLII